MQESPKKMEPRLEALGAHLEALELTSEDSIKRINYTLALMDLFGAGLGYSFGFWNKLIGSPGLREDVALLSYEHGPFNPDFVTPHFRSRAKLILKLLEVPEEVDLSDMPWLELIAQVVYLKVKSKYSREQTIGYLASLRKGYVAYVSYAEIEIGKISHLIKA